MERKETGEEKTSTINISQKERRKGILWRRKRGCVHKGERVFREQKELLWHSICDSKNEKKTQKKRQKQRKIIKRVLRKGKKQKIKRNEYFK